MPCFDARGGGRDGEVGISMEIKKIDIKNFGIFKNFEWDNSVIKNDGDSLFLKHINIIYGRNYSGKTTISRIFRALETKILPEKFESTDFQITLSDNSVINQDNYQTFNDKVRVFNEDFIRDNLRFIINPDDKIEPFAILGENAQIEQEIKELEDKLGSDKEGSETGLYKDQKEKKELKTSVKSKLDSKEKNLENKLSDKATKAKNSIKKQHSKFGDINYTISKLKKDISAVSKGDIAPIDNDKKIELETLIEEKQLNEIPKLYQPDFIFDDLKTEAKNLVEQKISKSKKIEELLREAILNRWVKEGRNIHKSKKLKNCAFCGNEISEDRWVELDRHFDEESEKLENSIDELLTKINDEQEKVKNGFKPDKSLFYASFHSKIEQLEKQYIEVQKQYVKELEKIKEQLKGRKNDILNEKIFEKPENYIENLNEIFKKYEVLRTDANKFSTELQTKQKEAKRQLLLREIYDFVNVIDYNGLTSEIETLKTDYDNAKSNFETIAGEIKQIIEEIDNKKRELNNEEEGAKKVNEYLNNFLGHKYLSLKAIEEADEILKDKHIKFEIFRGEGKAFNLSEGEKSLLAFCYFLAKLEDVNTIGSKPIIWIDDPISSLDNNHIFFIYSLINGEIVQKDNFSQLFISTHNLNFLKYLKRLPGAEKTKETKTKYRFLIIQRDFMSSNLSLMPLYLKDFVTEFNYLFKQLYECSELEKVDDSNYHIFYNFGNNARKFLEIFLFYKYPDNSNKKLEKFFGEGQTPVLFTDRINNEYSHLAGGLERGEEPIDVPEMNKVAKLILNKIKENDALQYKALLNSIGINDE